MKFSLNILDWQARAPGLSDAADWLAWAQQDRSIDPAAPQAKPAELPMMTSRRLNSGSRLAVDSGLAMLRRHAPDAVLFTSRHGELERNFRILEAIAAEQPISPTDFAMSVHNSSVGNLTITAKQPLVSSSLSAGQDTFQQGLIEALTLFHAGYQRVLMVDFDGQLPPFYHPYLPADMPTWAWSFALVLEAGDEYRCETRPRATRQENPLPQSLQFLRGYLRHEAAFCVEGERADWLWSKS
ncbi:MULTISPECIES: beta-ketoacyl synthase chain length factor [Atlantibacter]|uniref:Beta-ketoacyl synthase-like N-terminal domain-containing protein n=2 Tax=Atlantibacter hermannii TaxID=565 RepID=H5V3K9_ATLHE|nr:MULTISPECIES: beta-ketoacyl synthase chain length factor [Atlantibacter]MCQ4967306.1 beta-ketoacyl synthase chain length factor [Enterobacteriaceae bacterium DFI.7.85]HAI49884.1 beta-ketoacyl synthase [Enterobacteriaceae bacterium]MBW9429447.1 beta-ketoacyl synthase chain length factor [Atlantibacter hermannii]MDQ7882374.1 beta-ketoacyl synthase chain length factor [Atlantibacter hermannii]MDU1950172.1 beta-ketoacyl synthase chain length factor [Atlantibacter hermannii]